MPELNLTLMKTIGRGLLAATASLAVLATVSMAAAYLYYLSEPTDLRAREGLPGQSGEYAVLSGDSAGR